VVVAIFTHTTRIFLCFWYNIYKILILA